VFLRGGGTMHKREPTRSVTIETLAAQVAASAT